MLFLEFLHTALLLHFRTTNRNKLEYARESLTTACDQLTAVQGIADCKVIDDRPVIPETLAAIQKIRRSSAIQYTAA